MSFDNFASRKLTKVFASRRGFFSQYETIIPLREQNVMIDSDIAELYGIETRDVNKAVKNNPDKFPSRVYFLTCKRRENRGGGKFPPP